MGVVHAKVMGGLNNAQQGAGGVLLPANGKDPDLTNKATMVLADRIFGTMGITVTPKKKEATEQASIKTTNTLVGDLAKPLQGHTISGTGKVSPAIKTLGVKLVEGIMEQGINGIQFNKEDAFRDKITGAVPNLPKIPQTKDAAVYSPFLDFDYERILCVQYFTGYELDETGSVDIRSRRWEYVRETDLPNLADVAGKALLCRTYNTQQRSKDNGLEIPTENEYFLIIP
jgi:hypothetical protein